MDQDIYRDPQSISGIEGNSSDENGNEFSTSSLGQDVVLDSTFQGSEKLENISEEIPTGEDKEVEGLTFSKGDRELMRKFIKAVEAYGDIVADGQRLHQHLQYDIERLSQLVPPIQQLNQQLSNQPLEQLIRSLDTNSNIHFRR
ncbi:MAG TPA: hypothetical protein VJY47_03935 [Candidatus Dojkabacteria bacterium]|nr:hypothetical protein [Candidatus Dojkabacteria bacterium]